jgi:hypothetical protein
MFEIFRIIFLGQEPAAKISDKTLERLIRREFAGRAGEVNQKFQRVNSNTLRGKNRFSAAILKLANKDLDKIDHYISICNNDFRDVVASAEYPERMRFAFNKIAGWKKKQIYLSDWKEYSTWLHKEPLQI